MIGYFRVTIFLIGYLTWMLGVVFAGKSSRTVTNIVGIIVSLVGLVLFLQRGYISLRLFSSVWQG